MTVLSTASRAHRRGFWFVALAFLISMAFSTVPTPLYTIYQSVEGFAPWVLTVIFGVYAVGVMASLYFGGRVSDGVGRRRVLLASIALNVVADLVFLGWTALPALLVARFLNGLGIGLMTSTATAYLSELWAVSHPEKGSGTASLVATVVNMGGLALGPLVSGSLAQFVVLPLVVPYAVFFVLMVLSGATVIFVPETVVRPRVAPAYHPSKRAVVPDDRGTFFAASAGAFGAFAVLGLFTSLSPIFLARDLHEPSKFLAGLVTFGVFGAGTVAQVVLSRLSSPVQLVLGLGSLTLGLAAVAVGVSVASAPDFLVGALMAGVGVGLVFRTAIQMVARVAPPDVKGAVMAAVFLIAYAGLTVPVLGLGVALRFVGGPTALAVFAVLDLVVTLGGGMQMLKRLGGRILVR